MDDRGQIREILRAVNDAWRTAPPGEVAARVREYFADDAAIVGPDLARVARGGDAVAKSYDDFVSSARVLWAELDEPAIDVAGEVAAATLTWRMRYAYQGVESSEAGHDVYVLGRRDGRWLIVWRKLESHPAE